MRSKIDHASETLYRSQGMGQRIGFGERPAVLIIDMQHDFCDPDTATTLWPRYKPLMSRSASFALPPVRGESRCSIRRAWWPGTDRARGCGA